jgi:putative peptidoglycan lipid II flippase
VKPAQAASPRAFVHALVVVVASSASALAVGFFKSLLSAYYFGTSGAMDAYLLALLLPDMAMQLARTGAFNFIPLFAAERLRSEEDAWKAASKMLSYWLALLAAAVVLALVVAPAAMAILAPGYNGEQRAQTLELTRALLLMTASCGTGKVLGVVLHAERRFIVAGVSEVAFQAGSTLYLLAFHEMGIAALAWAQVFGGLLQLLVAAGGLYARRRQLRVGIDLKNAAVRTMIRLSLPVYLGDSGDKVNLIVTRAFGSMLAAGAVSALQYAYTPIEGLHRMLATPLATALFPFLSGRFAESDQRLARISLGRIMVVATVAFLPLSAVTWLLADPMVVVLFERGSFDGASTALTASALRLFAPSIFALGLNELIISSFHARQQTLIPVRAGFVRVACNALLCAAFAPLLGHRGIALATTLSLYVKLLVLAYSLRTLFTPHEWRQHITTLARIVLAVVLMFGLAYPFALFVSTPQVLAGYAWPALFGVGLLCLSLYGAALWICARRQFIVYLGLMRHVLWHRPVSASAA